MDYFLSIVPNVGVISSDIKRYNRGRRIILIPVSGAQDHAEYVRFGKDHFTQTAMRRYVQNKLRVDSVSSAMCVVDAESVRGHYTADEIESLSMYQIAKREVVSIHESFPGRLCSIIPGYHMPLLRWVRLIDDEDRIDDHARYEVFKHFIVDMEKCIQSVKSHYHGDVVLSIRSMITLLEESAAYKKYSQKVPVPDLFEIGEGVCAPGYWHGAFSEWVAFVDNNNEIPDLIKYSVLRGLMEALHDIFYEGGITAISAMRLIAIAEESVVYNDYDGDEDDVIVVGDDEEDEAPVINFDRIWNGPEEDESDVVDRCLQGELNQRDIIAGALAAIHAWCNEASSSSARL
jgi:hypothetical protein